VSVDTLCDVTARMAQDAALGCLVRAGIIKQRCYCMPAVMRSMAVSANEMHGRPPDGAVPPIVVWLPRIVADKRITWAGHAGFYERCDAVMYGDDADTGGGFAPCDADTALSEMDVSFL